MDNIGVAMLEGAFRDYEDKQRLNLEVLRTMIQTVCKRIKPDNEVNTDSRISRLEQMFAKIHDSEGRIVPKTPILTALSMINAPHNKDNVKHIHLNENVPVIEQQQIIDEVVVDGLDENDAESSADAEDAEAAAEDADAEDEEVVVEEEVEEEEEELELEEFTWKGKTYYKDSDNLVYDLNDDGEPEQIGKYNNGKILLD